MLPVGGVGQWAGAAAYARVQLVRWLAAAARADVYWDGVGAAVPRALTGLKQILAAGTLTLEARAASMLVVKLEGRFDQSTEALFEARGREPLTNLPRTSKQQGLVLLGAVAYF